MLRSMVSLAFLITVVCGCGQNGPAPVAQVPAAASPQPSVQSAATAPGETGGSAANPAPGTAATSNAAPSAAVPNSASLSSAAPSTATPNTAAPNNAVPSAAPSSGAPATGALSSPGGASPAGTTTPGAAAPAAPAVSVDELLKKAQGQGQRGDSNGLVATLREAVAAEPTHRVALLTLANVLQQVGGQNSQRGDANGANAMFLEAAGIMRKLRTTYPDLNETEKQILANALYNEACAHNLQANGEKALASLRESVDAGFSDVGNLEKDTDLASLRDKPEFKVIHDDMARNAVAEAKSQLAKGESFSFDFQLTDVDDKAVTLGDFKGKVLIVDFWGTWCPPCRMEIPHFVELRNKYGKDGLEIVGLNYERGAADQVKDTIKKFMTENAMNYRCAIGDPATQQKVPNLTGYPTTLFIDRTGKVRLKLVGLQSLAKLDAIVSVLLAESSPTESAAGK